MKKPVTYADFSEGMGLKRRPPPAVEQAMKDQARGYRSPLGGTAVKAIPLAQSLKQKGKPR